VVCLIYQFVQGECCGIYGANCPEWIISMEACNALGVCCVPLYDSLGKNAHWQIINGTTKSLAN